MNKDKLKHFLQIFQELIKFKSIFPHTVTKCKAVNMNCPFSEVLTLYWSVAGSTISRGLPFTLIRPFPLLQWATAVAVFC